jgi:hypothetical protein
MGRDSNEAIIFSNQVEKNIFGKELIVTSLIKMIAFISIISLNLFFIFTCLLYGLDKGIEWQKGWLIASLFNLLLDAFIKQATIALFVYFIVPNAIFDKTSIVRMKLNQSITSLFHKKEVEDQLDSNLPPEEAPFSVTDYLFVSHRLARKNPQLLESALVLQYRSQTLPPEMIKKLSPSSASPIFNAIMAFNIPLVLSSLFTTFILNIGCLSQPIQKVLVNTFNPLLIGASAYSVSVLATNPALLSVVCLISFISFSLFFFSWFQNFTININYNLQDSFEFGLAESVRTEKHKIRVEVNVNNENNVNKRTNKKNSAIVMRLSTVKKLKDCDSDSSTDSISKDVKPYYDEQTVLDSGSDSDNNSNNNKSQHGIETLKEVPDKLLKSSIPQSGISFNNGDNNNKTETLKKVNDNISNNDRDILGIDLSESNGENYEISDDDSDVSKKA